MSSVVDPQPERPASEELVAYLDGELAPEECRRVEERLSKDDSYRRELQELNRAWDALDVLPSPKTADDFARTTMELVTVAAQDEASAASASVAGAARRRKLWFAAAATSGAIAGFAAALFLLPNPNHALVRDLPAIRQADVLRQVESVDFLRQLSNAVPTEQLMTDEAAMDTGLSQLASINSPALEVRQRWIEDLPAEEKIRLSAEAERFNSYSTTEQQRMRDLARDVADAGASVQTTLLAYDQWLSRLTAGKREELRQELQDRENIADQLQLVRQLVDDEREDANLKLSREDAERLRGELRAIADERRDQLAAILRRSGDEGRLRRLEGTRGALAILAREMWNNNDSGMSARLVNVLSADARAHFQSLPPRRRPGQLWRWIGQSLQEKADPEEIERFFAEKLDNEERERLLSLPPNEMQAQLERLYYATQFGFADGGPWWHEGAGRPPGPPRDGRPNFNRDRPAGPPPGAPHGRPLPRDRGAPPRPI